MSSIAELRNAYKEALTPIYGEDEASNIFLMVMESNLGLSRIDLALNPSLEIEKEKAATFKEQLKALTLEVPVQQVLGEAWFRGMRFKVSSDVLIPRPETEELVAWILDELGTKERTLKALDIGTGSGCIAISLAKSLPFGQWTALDLSVAALNIAKQNAASLEAQVRFIQADALSLAQLDQNYDLIVSNPPYVSPFQQKEMKANVLDHEPHLALFVPEDDPLIFYKRIADLALVNLNPMGWLFFEINESYGQQSVELLLEKGFIQVELRKDFLGKDRMIMARKK